MKLMSTLFWIFTGIIFYTYIRYAGVLYILVRIKRLKNRKPGCDIICNGI